MSLTFLAPAKVNLYLGVEEKKGTKPQASGQFHYLKTIIHPLDFGDEITFSPSESFEFEMSGEEAPQNLAEEDNLAFKAAKLFSKHFDLDLQCKISVVKHIPSQAGLGGGSSDAACVLYGLNEFFELGASKEELIELGKTLSSDVAALLYQAPVLMGGFGDEFLEEFESLSAPVVLLKPKAGVSTKDAYDEFDKFSDLVFPIDLMLIGMRSKDIEIVGTHVANNLELSAVDLVPEIAKAQSWLSDQAGACVAHITGSGSCVFSVFDTEEEAKQAYDLSQNLDYWSCLTKLSTGIKRL